MDRQAPTLEQDSGAAFHPFWGTDPGISMNRDGDSLHKTIDRRLPERGRN